MKTTLQKGLVALIVCLFFGVSLAQTDLPKNNETGLFSFEKVVQQPNGNNQELYRRLISWVNKYYKNPKEVIKEQNDASQELLIAHRFKIFNIPEKGAKTDAGLVEYKLRVTCKDGRYRYELTNIQWKQTSSFPIERWTDPKYSKGHPEYASYLKQVEEQVTIILDALQKAMAETGANVKADW
jgi:hypothetical protein